MGAIICFGETLLRLSVPRSELLLQIPRFETCFGGAETNVAVSLARLGTHSKMVTVLPDNLLGRAAAEELRRHEVDTSGLHWSAGRMGMYFLESGAVMRPSQVLYDREHSAFATAPANLINWPPLLKDASRLHLSGITPALGPAGVQAATRAAEAARMANISVSFDGNYRAKLWERWNGDSGAVLRRLFEMADIAFADERDIALILGRNFDSYGSDAFEEASAAAFKAFPAMQMIACTKRVQHSVDHHELSAALATEKGSISTRSYDLPAIVDRVGSGDAFVAGFLHANQRCQSNDYSLDFGLAAAVLKHSIFGDFNLVREQDVLACMDDEGLQVRR